jgi:hypothetical protein
MRRAELLRINALGVLSLAVGFFVTFLVPKLLLLSGGTKEYGLYSVILAVALVPTFFDLGVTPGLTRELSSLHVRGAHGEARLLLRRLRTLLGGLALAASAAVVLYHSVRGVSAAAGGALVLPLLLGCLTNATTLYADLGFVAVRVGGEIPRALKARIAYLLVYLAGIVAFHLARGLDMGSVFAAQFLASLAYAALGARALADHFRRNPPVEAPVAGYAVPWKRMILLAVPEQVVRAQSSLFPGVERHLVLVHGGSPTVSAYDLAIRLSTLVTALPATLSAPLVALCAPNAAKGDHAGNRRILRHTWYLQLPVVALSLAAAWLLARFVVEGYYGMEGTPFLYAAAMVLLGSAVNVLSTTPAAWFYSHGRPLPVLFKASADLVVAVSALALLAATGSFRLYVTIRYASYFVTSLPILGWYLRESRRAGDGEGVPLPEGG